MERYALRRDKLRREIRKVGVDALLVTNFTNVTYLTGFTGDDSYLLLTAGGQAVLLSDSRFATQIPQECPGLDFEIRAPGKKMLDTLERAAKPFKLGALGIEGDSLTVAQRDALGERFPKFVLKTTSGLVEGLRIIKDAHEIAEIRDAVSFAQRAFAVIRASIRPEQTEKELADALEHQMRLFGAKGASFDTIVAVGERAALPHARPTNKRLSENPLLLIDWGANGRLYKSDLTRVLATARIPPKLQRVYGVVLKAQLAAIAAIRPGVSCEQVDTAARNVIEDAGFGRFFGHGLGHGVGLDIHESPRLGQGNRTLLEPGMIITIEPGIYLPGVGGVRIEDDILVTKAGHEVLTSVPKQWDDVAVA